MKFLIIPLLATIFITSSLASPLIIERRLPSDSLSAPPPPPPPIRKFPSSVIGSSYPLSPNPSSSQSFKRLKYAFNKNDQDEDVMVIGFNHHEDEPTAQSKLAISPSVNDAEVELPLVDSVLGEGAQSRILESVFDWVNNKVKQNPKCVKKFVCETYRTGETLEGIPYFIMKISNNAVAYTISEIFDTAIDLKEITDAGRLGRTVGSCHKFECDMIPYSTSVGIGRVGEALGSLEGLLSAVVEGINFALG